MLDNNHFWLLATALGSGVFWLVAYILIIYRGFKDQSYGMPVVAFIGNIAWEFIFGLRGRRPGELTVRGGSHLKLAADGRIAVHRDYWDVAEELYEKLPGLGILMRWLKRRAAS